MFYADNLVPSGKLGQIRLLLGDKNTVVVGIRPMI
jgi:hypothetical protein